MTSATVTLPQVMKVLDLATGDAPALQQALMQSAQRIAEEQGLTLNAERLAQAAQVVAQDPPSAGDGVIPSIVAWTARPITEADWMRRRMTYSKGLRGAWRRCFLTDEGKSTRLSEWGPLLALPGIGVAMAALFIFNSLPLYGVISGLILSYTLFGVGGEFLSGCFRKLRPVRLDVILRQQLMLDPTARAYVHTCETSAVPMLLKGDLDALMAYAKKRQNCLQEQA